MGSVRGGQVGGPSGWSSRSRPVASVAAPSRGHLPGRPVFENTFRFQRCSADWSLCKELGQACEMLGTDQKRSLLERNAKRTSMWPRSSVRQEPRARAQGGGPAARRRWRWTPPGPAGRPRRGSSRWAAASAPSPGASEPPAPEGREREVREPGRTDTRSVSALQRTRGKSRNGQAGERVRTRRRRTTAPWLLARGDGRCGGRV